ncbi:MAG: arsenate reductase ArsC [Chitinophagales bacterium]|nr:arsenate reductase ArsC [Chitinophagales bacterium]
MKRVLVLCTGNSSRSQMAEGYLKFYAKGKLDVQSAGLEDHGVNPFTIIAMNEDNIDIDDQFSKPLEYFFGESFDCIISVCAATEKEITPRISFSSFYHCEVEDPASFEGSDDEKLEKFREVREQIKIDMLKFLGKTVYSSESEKA